MSAYEDALRQVIAAYAPHDPLDLDDICHDFLAALPPSIVVDGRVVEAHAVLGVMNRERKLEVSMMELLDAAREVADAPSS